MTRRTWAYALAASALCFAGAISALAQPAAAPADNTVIDVKVEGNKLLSASAVLSYARTRVGQKFDAKLLDADQQRMLQSGYFETVSAVTDQAERGVIVTFVVVERPRAKVKRIDLVGAKSIKEKELRDALPFKAGGALNEFNVETGRRELLKKYRDKGFYFAEVSIDKTGLDQGQVTYRIVEGTRVRIKKIRFEGNTYFNYFKVREPVKSSARFWPFIDGYLDDDQVSQDADELRKKYVDEGFLDAEVDPNVSFSADKKNVVLTFRVRQGPRYRVNDVIVRGNTVYTDDEIRGRLKMGPGAFFTALSLKRDTKTIQDMYGEVGFIEARVESSKQFLAPAASAPGAAPTLPEPALVNVVFEVAERDQYMIGKIDIRGNQSTQNRVIRRELRFFPEQLFNTTAIQESKNRLMETRMFDDVTIAPTGKEPGVRDVLVQVKEGKTAQFIIGVGVSSNSGLLGNISFTQRNFDISAWPNSERRFWRGEALKGAGQTLSVVAEPGTEMTRFHIDWTEPYLFDKPIQLGNRIFLFTRGRETYDETRYGDVVSLGRRFPNKWYAEIAQRIEGVSIDSLDRDAPPEVRANKGSHMLLGTKATLVRDRTDSRWGPSNGDRLMFSYEQVYGSYNFGRAEGEYRIYRTVYVDPLERKHIWMGKLAAGQIIGDGPVFEKYYGGGTGSLRGFAYRGISPRSAGTDEPIGGKFMFLASTEYEYPLVGEALRGVVFLDSGTVENSSGLSNYRVSAGFGLRITIPMMGPVPMSFDFGFPLVKDRQDDTQVFSFNVGWAF